MSDAPDFSVFSQIVHQVAPNATLATVSVLSGGMSAKSYMLDLSIDGLRRSWVLRQPLHDVEYPRGEQVRYLHRVLELLQRGDVAAPRPVHCDPHGAALGGAYVLMTALSGEPDYDPDDKELCVSVTAEALASLHNMNFSDSERSLLTILPRDYIKASGFGPDDHERRLRTEQILTALQSAASQPAPVTTLVHGDFWPGNLLWHDGRLSGIVDWEDAGLGDPLMDLAIARLDLAWWLGLEMMDRFTEHYQRHVDLDYTMLPNWDLAAALRLVRISEGDFEDWADSWHEPPFLRPDITGKSMRDDYAVFVDRALAALEM